MGVNGWSLEVVRGKEIGRSYPLVGPSSVLGNALGGEKGIDLAAQEGDSPRRMAPRQAVITTTEHGVFLRDLDSPGGTFVNRQRLLPGQNRPLRSGDLIQLGVVQLHLIEANSPVDPSKKTDSFAYRLACGVICRSWDDFLRVASQKWAELCDEHSSGRIDAWLRSIGRTDLIVSPLAGASADGSLDAWLSRLPSTQPARADLDVHPKRLVIRVTPGGGTTSRSVQVANVGHRLLRISARIEPKATRWVKVADASSERIQTVIDSYDLPLKVTIPERLSQPLTATLVIDGNGGTRRVDLILEAKSVAESSPAETSPQVVGPGLREQLEPIPFTTRLIVLGCGGVLLRVVVGLSGGMLGDDGLSAPNAETPRLLGVLVVFATVFALIGAIAIGRCSGIRQAAFSWLSGAVGGAAIGALVVALCRAIEPLLGPWSTNLVGVGLLWSAIGVGLGALSAILVPVRAKQETAP